MGKKNQATGIGRTLIKDRFGKKARGGSETFLHTSELNDGYDWGRLNLQSVTEQNNLEDFLATAEMAGTEFTAEKLNVQFINTDSYSGVPDKEELAAIKDLHKQHAQLLSIPRRPHWTNQMSASLLDQNEKDAFLEWRRTLASLQEVEGIVMTPYEKNLDFWRQLWRVIERSDIVVQIVDARNPLLFYCSDLEAYVQEVGADKQCLLLINKADFLDQMQRDIWADYFSKRGIRIAFWSALAETNRQEQEKKKDSEEVPAVISHSDDDSEEEASSEDDLGDDGDNLEPRSGNEAETQKEADIQNIGSADSDVNMSEVNSNLENRLSVDHKESCDTECGLEKSRDNNCDEKTIVEPQKDGEMGECSCDADVVKSDTGRSSTTSHTDSSSSSIDKGDNSESDIGACGDVQVDKADKSHIANTGTLHSGEELLNLVRSMHTGKKVQGEITTVGMVGYPNVGKSSTINAILQMKKVPVSSTPGRTKHFQTVFVEPTLMLCDCPGLVFPSFVTTKADLITSSILPIDQMRDHIAPASLVCQTIPRPILEKTYGIIIPPPGEGEDSGRAPTANELLKAYGAMRGYMTHHGVPDCARASRTILKDYVNGKLLYCHPPPDIDPALFHVAAGDADTGDTIAVGAAGDVSTEVPVPSRIDSDFFRKTESTVHARTARSGGVDVAGVSGLGDSQGSLNSKASKRHNNRKKKEKMRRVYGYLDA